ncbi:hypothetical protein N752_04330 [Desulforamulus aquiferis]|nr:hypothetical protein N752_04330 [Desulforamulus aquiferis]
MLKSHEELIKLQQKAKSALSENKMRILVCAGTGCVANGSLKVFEGLKNLVQEKGLLAEVDLVKEVGHEASA